MMVGETIYAPMVLTMSQTPRTETALRGSGPSGVVPIISNERPEFRDRNVEIHARWRAAVDALEAARKRRNKRAIA